MRALLDINVLIALLDAGHLHHERASAWLIENATHGWASCPLTQNGCIRVMSQAAYANQLPPAAIIQRLATATAQPIHEFWPDDVSLLDPSVVDRTRIHGPRQVTDLYLVALSLRHAGCFVTFDDGIALSAVRGAQRKHVLII